MFPIFESRLRSLIDALRDLTDLSMTVQWKKDLAAHETEFWAKAISDGTTEKVKMLLSRDDPPSRVDLMTHDTISGDLSDPGSYFGFVDQMDDVDEDLGRYAYGGSATRVGRGLSQRTGQHSNPEYREKELKKHVKSIFYNVLQDPRRKVVFFLIMSMYWISAAASDITLTRIICVLAEQVYMIWFGSYAHSAANGAQKALARLGPWFGKTFDYTGTNLASPIRTDILRAVKDAEAMTPEEVTKRSVDIARERRKNWTPEELEEAQKWRAEYHQRVAKPVRAFKRKAKNRGMPKSDIDRKVKDFQKAERSAMNNELPPTNPQDIMSL